MDEPHALSLWIMVGVDAYVIMHEGCNAYVGRLNLRV